VGERALPAGSRAREGKVVGRGGCASRGGGGQASVAGKVCDTRPELLRCRAQVWRRDRGGEGGLALGVASGE
jgi:hypothetical protein